MCGLTEEEVAKLKSELQPEPLLELDVNPHMMMPEGQGVVTADALICINPDLT